MGRWGAGYLVAASAIVLARSHFCGSSSATSEIKNHNETLRISMFPRLAARCVGRVPQPGAMLLGLVIALAGSGAAVASTEADTLQIGRAHV